MYLRKFPRFERVVYPRTTLFDRSLLNNLLKIELFLILRIDLQMNMLSISQVVVIFDNLVLSLKWILLI